MCTALAWCLHDASSRRDTELAVTATAGCCSRGSALNPFAVVSSCQHSAKVSSEVVSSIRRGVRFIRVEIQIQCERALQSFFTRFFRHQIASQCPSCNVIAEKKSELYITITLYAISSSYFNYITGARLNVS